MIRKHPLDSHRLRTRPPRGFGWLDHRLLREGYLGRCSAPALALYCLLICASDGQGLSFYGEARLQQMLHLDLATLRGARHDLLALGLIAYREPLYQVLALEPGALPPAPTPSAPLAPSKARPARPPVEVRPAPRGLDLRAMVEGALQPGGKR